MAAPIIQLKVVVDTEGLDYLWRALDAAEELEDLATWRPEVKRLEVNLRLAIEHLRMEGR